MSVELLSGSLPTQKTAPSEGAFREHASGLIVPTELSREREVWTHDEWRTLERATKLLQARGLELFIGCTDERCKKEPVKRIRQHGRQQAGLLAAQ